MKIVYAGLVIAIIIAYKFRKNEKLLKVLLAVNVLLQITLFIWYLGYKELFIQEGLPLYHCRIAVIMTAVGYAAKKPKMTKYFAWLGIIGTIVAFGVPDPSDYMWPHLTNITFICTHYFITMSSLMVIAKNEVKLDLKSVVVITLIMNLVIIILNTILGSNYSYLMKLPPALPIDVNKYIIFALMTLLLVGGEMVLEKFTLKILGKRESA
ncbi:YwaF family protein [Mogibacterium pumilum]|nr:TIGR02206 family membrane protein [Mogibacterium pumilum]